MKASPLLILALTFGFSASAVHGNGSNHDKGGSGKTKAGSDKGKAGSDKGKTSLDKDKTGSGKGKTGTKTGHGRYDNPPPGKVDRAPHYHPPVSSC